jgi:NAD(P)-dependent dehydrogenase (short-subunit alcohol dehydrogenase family)
MAERLSGKRVLVTGGASGIGAACARLAAREGAASVVVADLDESRGARVAAELRELGSESAFVQVDVSDLVATGGMVETAAQLGPVDVLVAAAGISHAAYQSGADVGYGSAGTRAPLVDTDVADWHRVLAVNLHGLMYTNQAVARHMIATRRRGSIVNITSMNSYRATPGIAPYSVSKAGAWMLTKTLALELAAHDIRVNAVGPGFIDTPMNAQLRADDGAIARTLAATPLGRLGRPDDIAYAVVYLASDEAAFVTGSMLCPDGGFIAATR